MIFEILNQDNVEDYIAYLKIAMSEEPNMMTAEKIDEQGIKARILDPFFNFYLIRTTNEDANRFYKNFESVELSEVPVLRKYMKKQNFSG